MNAVDTNLYVYALDADEPVKKAKALELLARLAQATNTVLIWQVAAGFLKANPAFGNPHVVRCDWCHETRTLFRDENEGPFKLTSHGWLCEPCNVRASSQEVKF